MRENAPVDENAWHRRTEVPLMAASLAYLIAYSWRVIADLSGPARVAADVVILVTWGMFVVDYLTRLVLATQRRVWFRRHLPALAFALVPVLRLVRLLRFLTHVPGMGGSAGDRLRTQIMVYGAGASVVLIYVSALAVLEAERHAPHATITTFDIAIWWASVTVTTTGYGDFVPVTSAGRWVGVGLMFGGVALAGIITAALASWVLERASRNRDDNEPATRAQVRGLIAKVDALVAAGGAVPGGTDGDPHTGSESATGGDDRPGG